LGIVRLVFLGSPAFALPSLEALDAAGHEVALVVTQPDRPAGRGQKTTPPPVAVYAREHGLPLWQTTSLRGAEAEARLREVQPEAMALAAFAALVPNNVLGIAPRGILNVHPSLLPRWRGAAPIQAALLAGDTETGVSIIRLVAALDAGPMFAQERLAIAPSDDYVSLESHLSAVGARLLVRVLNEWPEAREQDDAAATYCRKIERDDARIDWAQPSEVIWRQVRAYRGWPQAFTLFGDRHLKVLRATPLGGERAHGPDVPGREEASETLEPGMVTLHAGIPVVATGRGALRLDEVQLEGKRAMTGAELARGYPSLNGTKLA
jgi:methionyl-tRNA formyltransferase